MDITNERLIELYTLKLEREGKPHKLGDVVKYLETIGDDLYIEWIDGEPYIDHKKINSGVSNGFDPFKGF